MKWIESLDGPLIAMPRSRLDSWGGADLEHPMEGDDYGRACSISDYVGKIELGEAFALVLGDTPDRTTVVTTSLGVVIVRWHSGDSEQEFWDCFYDQVGPAERIEEMSFVTEESEFLLFDSVLLVQK